LYSDRRHDRHGDEQPHELGLGEPSELAGEALGQPLHQEQAQAAEQADGRQQNLVGAAPRQHLGEMREEQRPQVDRQQCCPIGGEGALRNPHARLALARAKRRPERDRADRQRERDDPQQP
jgi:hypothetical protein